MNILQVNYTDSLGHRFNGGALIPWFRARGHNALHAVGVKQALGNESVNLAPQPGSSLCRVTSRLVNRIETASSIHNILYPQSFLLPFHPSFKAANIIHYHIIHNHFFSYMALPWLSKLKPTVWSLHDPWALTGHCVHPFDCEEWKSGCRPCLHLDYPFAISQDRAWLSYKLKNLVYRHSRLNFIVASRWMLRKVEQSPLLGRFPVYHVPFGLDLNVFSPGNKAKSKAKLGIPTDRVVISLRALEGPYKGFEYALKALELLPAAAPIHILTCQRKKLLTSLAGKFEFTELGEVEGDLAMVDFFRATDIHLMPSMAESFGMMAMEAAACGVPSVVFSGTPLAEICFAPEGGAVVDRGDALQLSQVLFSLIQDEARRRDMGQKARKLAVENYSFEKYADSVLKIYEQILANG
jgi:glycosyltransferase involved in cell wall biosynthesis